VLVPAPEHHHIRSTESAETVSSAAKRNRRLRKVGTTLALMSMPFSAYAIDVRHNMNIQAEATIDVSVEHEALDPSNNDKAIVFFDGTRSTSGDDLIEYRGNGLQQAIDGQLWSVGYNDAVLDPDLIGKELLENAQKYGVTALYLYGESAGGVTALDAQAYVRAHSNIIFPAHFLNSVPYAPEGLRQARQDEIALVETLAEIPGAKYSSFVSFVGESIFRSDRYISDRGIDLEKAYTTTQEILADMAGSKQAGNWLMFDQLMAIKNANIRDRIIEMGLIPDDIQRPVIIYIGTRDPGRDYMVDDDLSAAEIKDYTDEAGITFIHIEVPGAVHSRPDIGVAAFESTIAEAAGDIQNAIDIQKQIAYFYKYKAKQIGLE
jgi:hypothetical protein